MTPATLAREAWGAARLVEEMAGRAAPPDAERLRMLADWARLVAVWLDSEAVKARRRCA